MDNIVFVVIEHMQIPYPLIPMSPQDIKYKLGIQRIMSKVKNVVETSVVDEKLVRIVLNNYESLIQTSIIHIRKLKRFIAEHFSDLTKVKKLNPKGISHYEFFLFYILYLIGKQGKTPENPDYIYALITENIAHEETLVLDDALIDKLKIALFNDTSYPELLLKGVNLVNDAPYSRGH